MDATETLVIDVGTTIGILSANSGRYTPRTGLTIVTVGIRLYENTARPAGANGAAPGSPIACASVAP
ncbi:MAG TPA: hypothetical protein VK578_24250 [Edaphobacter sp.]|nr:hypothetical protein [Edaphobacter sp.]